MEELKIEKVTAEGEIGWILENEIYCEFCPGYVLAGTDKTCLGEEYVKYAEHIKNLEVFDDDVWVASYPKTGTTWTQEMVWLIANNFDYEVAKVSLSSRFPFFESCTIVDAAKFGTALKMKDVLPNSIETVANFPKPRFIKTHLPFSLLPDQIKNKTKTPKIIYVTRNPKDVCVSYYHHGNLCQGWKTDVENFAKIFMADLAMYGSFWKHVLGFWECRDWSNVLIIKYEDMKENLPYVIQKVAQFLNKDNITEEQISTLAQHLSFESMKNNLALNGETFMDVLRENNLVFKDSKFIRSGTVGKYKEELSQETIKKLDEWIKQNISGSSFEKYYDFNL